MLSIERCRELIPDNEKLTDAEIIKIRDSLYGMAELALECYFEDIKNGTSKKE